jgi:ribosomal protein S18 acetylase RimI-like enzyme
LSDPELPRLRSALGASAAVWAAVSVEVEPGRWRALSGAFSPRYNLVLCHGPGVLAGSVEEVEAGRLPAIVMIAGEALAEVEELSRREWACVAKMPFMRLEVRKGEFPSAPSVRPLHGAEVDDARALIADVFGLHDRLALVALPPGADERPGQAVWGAFDGQGALVSCVISVEVDGYFAIWSLATLHDRRRRGHAARLMRTVLAEAAAGGAATSLLYAPIEAEPFYRSLGYEVLERWQVWSPRRWATARY